MHRHHAITQSRNHATTPPLVTTAVLDEEFPASADALRAVGGRQLSMVADELAKVDGALTCCALFL